MNEKEYYNIQLLESVEKEIIRFKNRFETEKIRLTDEVENTYTSNSHERAALIRSCLDLKKALTRITQSKVY